MSGIRLLGTLFVLLLVWVAVTVYNEGTDRAFGGFFARLADSSALETPANRSTPDRSMDGFQRAYNKSETRVDRLLDQRGGEE